MQKEISLGQGWKPSKKRNCKTTVRVVRGICLPGKWLVEAAFSTYLQAHFFITYFWGRKKGVYDHQL
ncbi:MAG TPA: hypothetical protein VG842_06915 [Sediminibacterium sp.]|nr:hypothetical protein [Sediminibacterium sp.]